MTEVKAFTFGVESLKSRSKSAENQHKIITLVITKSAGS
jgi:hypothetical protein